MIMPGGEIWLKPCFVISLPVGYEMHRIKSLPSERRIINNELRALAKNAGLAIEPA